MREKKPFMVEFTGTPEAGKTTAIKVVSNMLGSFFTKMKQV